MPNRTRRSDGYTITKRKDGRWEARILTGYNANGNPIRKSVYARTRNEAVEEIQNLKRLYSTGQLQPQTKEITLSKWLNDWLETYIRPHRAPKTYHSYEGFVRVHLIPALGSLPIRKVTPTEIQQLLNTKSHSELSAYTVLGMKRVLHTAMAQAWKNGLIEHNPAARVNSPKLPHRDPQSLTAEQVQRFLAEARGHVFEHLFSLACLTGLRLGEVLGLQWGDFDPDRKSIRVARQLQRGKDGHFFREPKTKESQRHLALSQPGVDALLAQRSLLRALGVAPHHDLIFVGRSGAPIDQKTVNTHLKKILVKAGLPPLSFHKLRHTVATLMVAQGVNLHTVKQQLGHSQISLTANLYAHEVESTQRKAVEELEQALNPTGV